jgi:hypothetical protein
MHDYSILPVIQSTLGEVRLQVFILLPLNGSLSEDLATTVEFLRIERMIWANVDEINEVWSMEYGTSVQG